MSDPIGWPPDEAVIQAIHDRYQREIVEDLGLCPFARRSRELGRVHRPVFVSTDAHEPSPSEVARHLAQLVAEHRDAEIILLTFPVPPGHRWNRVQEFERFLADLRPVWASLRASPPAPPAASRPSAPPCPPGEAKQPPPREFYMVAFHPRLEPPADRALTADSLISVIRRSPDPVIQCVDATLLDRVRRQAQASARERMIAELEARDPALAALFAQSVSADPELSSDIARHNFEAHGGGVGRERLVAALEAILAERDRVYGLDD